MLSCLASPNPATASPDNVYIPQWRPMKQRLPSACRDVACCNWARCNGVRFQRAAWQTSQQTVLRSDAQRPPWTRIPATAVIPSTQDADAEASHNRREFAAGPAEFDREKNGLLDFFVLGAQLFGCLARERRFRLCSLSDWSICEYVSTNSGIFEQFGILSNYLAGILGRFK